MDAFGRSEERQCLFYRDWAGCSIGDDYSECVFDFGVGGDGANEHCRFYRAVVPLSEKEVLADG